MKVPLYNDRDIGDSNKQGTVLYRSLDLNPCDFSLWFMLNNLVYSSNACTDCDMGEGNCVLYHKLTVCSDYVC